MTAIIVLNIVLIAVVFAGILTLLGWGIASDRGPRPVAIRRRRRAPRPRAARVLAGVARQSS